jgi:diaminohydroxyphosphoribosylaminopyrimidine deaminase/5-amino-6-(5-phosphoribosylamino)uracil reductase
MFTVDSRAPALVATLAPEGEGRPRGRPGVEVIRCRARAGRVDLEDLLRRLAARGVAHLLVEGGAEVHAAFLAARLVDRVVLHVAPKILGGGKDWLGGPGPLRMADALPLRGLLVRRLGEDLIVSGQPAWPAAARVRRSAPASGTRRRAR